MIASRFFSVTDDDIVDHGQTNDATALLTR